MNETENPIGAKGSLDRRTVLKGAAWSVPVLAAAIAAPMASASAVAPSISISADCLLSVAGAQIGRGFEVRNDGTGAYEAGSITVTETISLSGLAAAPGVSGILFGLMAVQGILGGNSASVQRGSWNRPFLSNTATRTVTLSGPLAAGEARSWGLPADAISGVLGTLGLVGLADISHTAVITSPTGAPLVTRASDSIEYELISGSC